MRELAYAIATFFGCGYSPIAPGTAGSLAAIAIAIAIHNRAAFLILAALLLIPAIWSAGKVAQYESRKDPQIVVIDEVLGQWITLAGASTLNWESFPAAVFIFRVLFKSGPPQIPHLGGLP